MAIADEITSSGTRFHSPFAEFFRRDPVLAGGAMFMALLIIPTFSAMLIETRELSGRNVWAKPLKFELALAVYLATLAWFAAWLPEKFRTGRWFRIYIWIIVACCVVEMVWIGGAAAAGTASHFNNTNTFMAAVYPVMGVLAVTLTSASVVFAIHIHPNKTSGLAPAFKLSVVLGLILTFVLTVLVAGYIASQPGHAIGVVESERDGFPIFGWLRSGGDLRVAHFFSTHALHFLPVVGFMASSMRSQTKSMYAVWLAALLYLVFVAYTFVQAIMAQPFAGFIA
ncbi:MAG: hypothetical protein AB3N20_14445 [Rhizobiaceae bacterium]